MHTRPRRARSLPVLASLALAGLALATPALAQTPSFTLVGFPSPYAASQIWGLSADGRSAAGFLQGGGEPGFLWTADGGRNDFGIGISLTQTQARGISGDGRTVVGGGTVNEDDAFRWSAAGGYQTLGTLPGYAGARAVDASLDGSVIVGSATDQSGVSTQAFRWTAGGGLQGLGAATVANAISADASTIVGSVGIGPSGFRWTQSSGLQLLAAVGGSGSANAVGVNFDGSLIVGKSGPEPFATMWVNGVPVELTAGIGSRYFGPAGVSDDGSVVAGQISFGGTRAGVWTQDTGSVNLADYLTLNGVTLPTGIVLAECMAVSSDGKTFAGWTSFGPNGIQGFIATIPTPGAVWTALAMCVWSSRRRWRHPGESQR